MALVSGQRVHLQAMADESSLVLVSEVEAGTMMSLGEPEGPNGGWTIILKDTAGEASSIASTAPIPSGGEVMLRSASNGTYMHCNGDAGLFAGGGWEPQHGWVITALGGSEEISLGDAVSLTGLSTGTCLQSKVGGDGALAYGAVEDSVEVSWRIPAVTLVELAFRQP